MSTSVSQAGKSPLDVLLVRRIPKFIVSINVSIHYNWLLLLHRFNIIVEYISPFR